MKKPFPNPKPISSATHSTSKYQQKHECPRSKKRDNVASGASNLLDEQIFSGMNESEESSGVSAELILSISNHDLNNHKRKHECPRLILSCSPTSKKSRAAEIKHGEIIASVANNYTDFLVSSATRNLLDQPFFSGFKTEGSGDYEGQENSRVSTELSLFIDPENLEPDKKIIAGSFVDETLGINDAKVSTELKLFDESWVTSNSSSQVAVVFDPWKIKKELTASDISRVQMRLLVPSGLVKEHILPLTGATEEQIDNGIHVRVWDCDTSSLHNMKFQRWSSSNSYILNGKWIQEFVERRKLKEKDTIGLYWNVAESRFHFCVLQRAASQVVNLLPCV